MIEHLQPGHLDADTLSAFAEGALAAHEREAAYAHLAVCADCRELVHLTQPAVEEGQAIALVPERRGFTGWRWVWSSAAAFATVALGAVLLMHPKQQGEPPIQMAKVEPSPVLSAAPPEAQPAPARKAAPLAAAKVAKPEPPPAAADPAGIAATTAQTNFPFLALRDTTKPNESVSKFHGAMPTPLQAPLAVTKPGGEQPLGYVARSVVPANPGGITPAPALPAAAAQAAEQVTVNAAPLEVETQNASVTRLILQLPSRLPVTSSFAQGTRVVATDPAGAVFYSADAGVHWTPVKPAWGGGIVTISSAVVSVPPSGTSQLAAPRAAEANARIAAKQTPIFALTTAAGERWTSANGTQWMPDERVR